MCRKLFGGLALLAIGSYLWMGTSVGSYARTAYVSTMSYFQGQVPLEFELERAKQLVTELDPDIHKAARDIVVEEVRISRLQEDVKKAETDLAEQELAIKGLRDQLKNGLATYKIGDRKLTRDDLERDLNRRFRAFKRCTDNLAQRQEILGSRTAKLDATRDAYAGLIETKKELQAQIEDLDSQHKLQQAKRVATRMSLDSTRFNEARQALDNLRERLAVDQKLIEQEGYMSEPIPVDDLPPANLTEEIDAYFGDSTTKNTTST